MKTAFIAGIAALAAAMIVPAAKLTLAEPPEWSNAGGMGMGMGAMMDEDEWAEKWEDKIEKKLERTGEKMEQMMGKFKDVKGQGEGLVLRRYHQEESVIIRPDGSFRVSGAVVNSVNVTAKIINASLYGLSRDVYVGDAKFYGGRNTITLEDIKMGDKLVAIGTFDKATKTIKPTEINDISYKSAETTNIERRIQELMKMLEELRAKLQGIRR